MGTKLRKIASLWPKVFVRKLSSAGIVALCKHHRLLEECAQRYSVFV